MRWYGFWTLTVVYGILLVTAWFTSNAAVALIVLFLAACQLIDLRENRHYESPSEEP